MTNRLRLRPALFLACLIAMTLFFASPAAAQTEKHVLILLPNTRDYPAHEAYADGIRNGLKRNVDFSCIISYEYLNLGFFTEDASYLDATARYFRLKYANRQPDAVVVGSDLYDFIQQYGRYMFPNAPIFMAWHQNRALPSNAPPGLIWVRGNLSEPLSENIQLILRTRPLARKIYLIIGNSPEERRVAQDLKSLIQPYQARAEFVFLHDMTYEQMLQQIRQVDAGSAILFIRWIVDSNGKRFIPAQVLQQLHKEAHAPIYATMSQLLGLGTVGGVLFSFPNVGEQVGQAAAKRIREGPSASALSPGEILHESVFDWRELKRWGISTDTLPPGSRIEYREPSVWESYQWYFLGGAALVLLETALLILLWINRRRRKYAEKKLVQLNLSLENRVSERTRELEEANLQLLTTQSLLQEANQQLNRAARIDSLTGLYNRRHMDEALLQEQALYNRTGAPFAIVFADIDKFKQLNDAHGHDAGDFLLRSIAEDIVKQIRTCDIAARWGGEEFLVLLPAAELQEAMVFAERIRSHVEAKLYRFKQLTLSTTMTLGVAVISPGETADDAVKRADIALYRGKREGRNRVVGDESELV